MSDLLFYFLLFLFGASIGSFACVVVARHQISSPWSGRSKCMACNKSLASYELIPIFSFLFLKGRCGKCKVKIDREYFWTEIVAGILAILTYYFFLKDYFELLFSEISWGLMITGILFAIFYTFLLALFLIIILYDLKHKIVPLLFSICIIIIGVAFAVFRAVFEINNLYNFHTIIYWLDIFSGFLVALPFFLFFIFSKGKAVGGGDILLYFGIGSLAGFTYGVSIFLISIWLGAIVALILILSDKNYTRKSQIPFAPFILIATILVLFWKIDVVGLAYLF